MQRDTAAQQSACGATAWRARFIELCEATFREFGFPPPPVAFDASDTAAMAFSLDALEFEIVHATDERLDQLLAICTFDPPATTSAEAGLAALFAVNGELLRNGASLGAVGAHGTIAYCIRRSLEGIDAHGLFAFAADMAAQVQAWHAWWAAAPVAPVPLHAPATEPLAPFASAEGGAFNDFVTQLCRKTGSELLSASFDGLGEAHAELRRGEVDFRISTLSGAHGNVRVDCLFGALPEERAAEQAALRRLLQVNRAISDFSDRAGFTVDPITHEARFERWHSLDGAAIDDFSGAITSLTDEARAWRGHFYAEESPFFPPLRDLHHAFDLA